MLDEAIAEAKERAQERCVACQVDATVDKDLAGTVRHLRMHPSQHTCDGDLAAVCDVAVEAARQAICDFQDAIDSGEAWTAGCTFVAQQKRLKRHFGLPEDSKEGEG
jgi:hypothetical protein